MFYIFDDKNPHKINDRIVIENGRFDSKYSIVEKISEPLSPADALVRPTVWKVNKDGKEVFVVEYIRRMNEEVHKPGYFPKTTERVERNHVKFARTVLRYMERELDIFPGNKHKTFWIEVKDLQPEPNADGQMVQPVFPEFHLYFEREFLGHTFDEQLRTGPPIETKMKWFQEVMQASIKLYWYVLYIQIQSELPIRIHNNTAYIDMDPLIVAILDQFNGKWLFEQYPNSIEKYEKLRSHRDSTHVWNCLLTDMLFKMFYRRNQPSTIIETELIWWRLRLKQYSLKDLVPYFSVEVFVIMARVFNSRNEHDLSEILQTIKLNPSNKPLAGKYKRVEPFHWNGGFGDVYIVEQEMSRRQYALKVVSIRTLESTRRFTLSTIEENIKNTMLLEHPNIIKFVDVWFSDRPYGWVPRRRLASCEDESDVGPSEGPITTTSGNTSFASAVDDQDPTGSYEGEKMYLFILMEACTMSLSDAIKNSSFDTEKMFTYMEEMLNGMEYLNLQGYMHRDMKPDNALINKDGRLVLCDFDFLIPIPPEDKIKNKLGSFGTPGFKSPEMKKTGIYNEKTDYYSVGITFSQILLGDIPSSEVVEIFKKDYLPDIQLNLAHTFLLRWMTEEDSKLRAGYYNIKNIIHLMKSTSLDNYNIVRNNYHYIDLVDNQTGKTTRCLRVAKKFPILRHIVLKYTKKEFQIWRKEDIERLPKENPNQRKELDWAVDFVGEKVTLAKKETNYCYFIFENNFLLPSNGTKAQLKKEFFAGFNRYQKITDELDILEILPTELINSELTLYWSPEKFSGGIFDRDDAHLFQLGLAFLRFYCPDVSEEEFIVAARKLQKGESPEFCSNIDPESKYFIYSMCSMNPRNRMRCNLIENSFSYDQHQIVERDSYRSYEFFKDGLSHPFAAIISISNRKPVVEAFVGRMKACVISFQPETMVKEWIPLKERGFNSKKMLDVDESGRLIEVVADDTVINIVTDLRGHHFKTLWQDQSRIFDRLEDIHKFFDDVYLSKHSYHGNISLDNLRFSQQRRGYARDSSKDLEYTMFGIPELTVGDREKYKKSVYASPEQQNSNCTTSKSDVFSCGVLLYELLCLAFDIEPTEIEKFQLNQKVQLPDCFAAGYESIVSAMTAYEPSSRAEVYVLLEFREIESSDFYQNMKREYERQGHVSKRNPGLAMIRPETKEANLHH